jgi:hypothetical protein
MRFIYQRGLRPGKPNQKVTLQIEDGDVRIRHAGLFTRWECRLPFGRIREVRVHGETLEIDLAGTGGLTTVVLDGPDARAVERQLARLADFAAAVTALSRELGHPAAP